MSMKQTLTAAMVCALALSFNAFAKVAYDNEVTNAWFSVTAANADLTATGWTKPGEGEVSSDDSGIKLDTDLGDPLIYKPTPQSSNVAIVSVNLEATANTAEPTFDANPQAALTVIVSGAETNWYGLVGGAAPAWEKFTNVIPNVGAKYDVKIEFDLRSTKRIRYSVGNTVLIGDGSTDGWYSNPQTGAGDHITSVSFAGTGDIGNFGGQNVAEAEAGFDGQNYTTFALALAEAKKVWPGVTTPVVLYRNVSYSASATETLYVNANNHTFTINGEVAVDQDGYKYEIKAGVECEAKIDSKYYSTIEKAIAAATEGQTITVNKAITKALTFDNASVTLDTNGKTVTCATLTVANGVTLTLANALAVTTATVNGAVAGETLTVKDLTGWNIAKLALAADAVITYDADHVLHPTSVSSVTINGLGAVKVEDVVLDAAPTSWTANGLPADKCLEAQGGQLVVASVAKITEVTEGEGYDYTNGTVNVTATVKSGEATAVLTVVGWDGKTVKTAEKPVTSGTVLTWDVADVMEGALTPGGAYTYTVDVKVGDTTVATKTGEFTAAKWGDGGDWFYANASTGASVVDGGVWVATPEIENKKYMVEDSLFEVTSVEGSNKFTRVDTKVSFESLVDGAPDAVSDAIGGFVATTEGWKALGTGGWVTLSGGAAPAVNVEYVIRAELDFPGKRVRFLVDAGDGAGFVALSNATDGAWVAWTKEQKTLQAVEFKGSGALASINATVASKALAVVVGDGEYDSMADALAAAQRTGAAIELLTNATIEPDRNTPGKYAIVVPEGYEYMSGGMVSRASKTIIVDGTGKPPVVRLNDSEMRDVRVPGVNAPVRNIDKLRKFLEDSKIDAYTDDDASASRITTKLLTPDTANGLVYWQDYALGIVVGTSVDPVTTPVGDTDANNITLAIPAVNKANYSGDYGIKYQVTGGRGSVDAENPDGIGIPLEWGTGVYTIKVLFTPVP